VGGLRSGGGDWRRGDDAEVLDVRKCKIDGTLGDVRVDPANVVLGVFRGFSGDFWLDLMLGERFRGKDG
jgi:hypothetical protein